MHTRLLLPCLALAACGPDPWSVPVPPNPGTMRLQLASDDGAAVTTATAVLDEIRMDHCEGAGSRTMVRALVSVETTAPYLVDGGWWCGVDIAFTDAFLVSATVDGLPVDLELEVGDLAMPIDPKMWVDGLPMILQLGPDGWLSGAVSPTEATTIGPGDPEHDVLVELLEQQSAVWIDADADGVLDDEEIEGGPLGTGPERG